jgi:hypothetical protein
MSETVNKQNKGNYIKVLILILALPTSFLLGFFLYPILYGQLENPQMTKIKTADDIELYADSLYQALQKELEFYRSQTDTVFPNVFVKEEALEKQYIRLQNMIAQVKKDEAAGKNVYKNIIELKAELLKLQEFVDEQTLSIAEIRRQNAVLMAEKKALDDKLRRESGEKESLEKVFDELMEERKDMSEKVRKASVLRVSNIKASGNRQALKGTDKETDRAKQIEFIKVCFNVVKNEVATNGLNKFYVLITDPTGWPIVVESRGSGKIDIFENKRKNTYYTVMKSFNYSPEINEICLTWSQVPNKPFEKGTYNIEIFNAGHSVGETKLVLR